MTAKKKKVETKSFETEIQQLLQLITHSMYSNKEIFVRELVSNASDAIDKARFLSLTDTKLLSANHKFEINLSLDNKKKTLTITDNGIGMNKDELIKNIGTIARSGSKEFLKNASKGKDDKATLSLIGQFGVGFYSVFMVADKVVVNTKKAGEKNAYFWTSAGKGEYSIEESDKKNSGTEITLYINKDGEEFLEDWKLRSIIRKFSDYVTYDIKMPKIDTRSEEDKKKDAKEGKIFKQEIEVINSGKALWARPKSEITDEMYEEFYKHISHDYEAPLSKTHFKQEGLTTFSSILFVPKIAPFDLFTNADPKGLNLYVNKVFIMDDCKELIPLYLRFVKGVVDSEDLPLNVSREMLQQNSTLATIKKALTKKVLSLLKEMSSKNEEDYDTFWKAFGIVLKEGVHTDFENKDKISPLLRFASTNDKDGEKLTSLKNYISRMSKDQKDIYYITSESLQTAKSSPHLEVFNKKDLEVLLLVDPVDEWVASSLTEFEGRKLVSITKGELDLGDISDEEKKETKKATKEIKKIKDIFMKTFKDNIKDVRATSRLTESPCCLVADANDMGENMERIMRMSNQAGAFSSKKILEINPTHPIIEKLNILVKEDAKSEEVADWAHLLYDQAILAQGSKVDDPKAFNSRLNKVLAKAAKN